MMDDGTIPASRPAAALKVSMIALHVPDMTCGHCVGTVTKAVQDVDRTAQIRIDLDSHRVEIEPSAGASTEQLVEAIREAGYTPELA